MRLLLFTQVVDSNDAVLGFMHGWILEFAKHVDSLQVIALQVGRYDFPSHVSVVSLGKEHRSAFFQKILIMMRVVFGRVQTYDHVFIHMNSEYIILFGWWWRLTRKRIGLWHTHKSMDWRAKIGTLFSHIVFTASPESFRLRSQKVSVVGHGIDVDFFNANRASLSHPLFHILSIARLTRIKGYDTMISAFASFHQTVPNSELLLIGGPLTPEDGQYLQQLKKNIAAQGLSESIHLVGAVPHKHILPYLHKADIFVNCSETGSLDKTILEAMAVGLPVLSSNEGILSTLGKFADQLMFPKGNSEELTRRFQEMYGMKISDRQILGAELRKIVEKEHSLSRLIPKIVELLQ